MTQTIEQLLIDKKKLNNRKPTIVLYGRPGVGKTTLAEEFPKPLFFLTEMTYLSNRPEVQAVVSKSYDSFCANLSIVYRELVDLAKKGAERPFKTIVIDSFSGFEKLAKERICTSNNVSDINLIPYGGGYKMLASLWNQRAIPELKLSVFDVLSNMNRFLGMYVILICHDSSTRKRLVNGVEYDETSPDIANALATTIKKDFDEVYYLDYELSQVSSASRDNKKTAANIIRKSGRVLLGNGELHNIFTKTNCGVGKLEYRQNYTFKELAKFYARHSQLNAVNKTQ